MIRTTAANLHREAPYFKPAFKGNYFWVEFYAGPKDAPLQKCLTDHLIVLS